VNMWREIESKYYMQTVRRQPIVIVKGEGSKVWDDNGKEYLDFTAGWAVNNLGHSHPKIIAAIQEQSAKLLQTSNQFYTIPQLELVQLLVESSCMDRVFLCNSGAEANEGAVKLARKYGRLFRNGAYEVITAMNSFHGRTMAMIAATGQPHYQEAWKPLPVGFVNVEYNDLEAIQKHTTEKTCAVMLEPVQGEAGVIVPSSGYLEAVRQWCDEQGVLLIFDEVQTGLGRLGTLFGYQYFGVEPDVMTLAKALGGGVPIGAFMAKEKYCVLEPGDHGSTFGGNALTSAAAFASTKHIVENDVPAKAAESGAYLRKQLNGLQSHEPIIAEVRGIGLLLAIEFKEDISSIVVAACNEEGLLMNSVRPNAIRMMPPLIVKKEEMDLAIERFARGLHRVLEG